MAGFMNYGNSMGPSGEMAPAATPADDYYSPSEEEVYQPLKESGGVPWPEERPSARMDLFEWFREWYVRFRFEHRGWTWWTWVKSVFPVFSVIFSDEYAWKHLLTDVLAGCTVAAMLVPQGLSYAKLAGLPSVYGLYGGFLPLIVYGLLGTCRQLGVGPVAVTSMVLGSGLPDTISPWPVQSNPNSPANPEAQKQYNYAAIQVAFLAGLMYTGVGLLNLGWLTNFLSHAVISGFMSGACVIIGLGQVKYIFGYNSHPGPNTTTNTTTVQKYLANVTNTTTNVTKLANLTRNITTNTVKTSSVSFPRDDPIYAQLANLFSEEWLPYFMWREFAMGFCWFVFIVVLRKVTSLNRRTKIIGYFGPLLVVIMSTALTYSYRWDLPPANIRITGTIPSGIPGPTVSWFFPMTNFGQKMLLAVIVLLIDLLESISIARVMASLNGYHLNPTAEIRGLGIANIVGACFNCYTTTGSFSRSSLTNAQGTKSQLAGIVTALCMMLVLLCLTGLFTYLPLNAMAAIIISSMPALFNWREFLFLYKVNKFDCLVFTTACICVMFLGVEYGLAVAIGVSLAIVILYSAFPQVTILGNVHDTEVYRNVKQFPTAEEVNDCLIVRIDAPIYFANINPLRTTLLYLENRAEVCGRQINYLVFDLSGVSVVDGSAVHFLKALVEEQRKRGIQVVLVQPNRQVVAMLIRSGLDEKIGREYIGMDMHRMIQCCSGSKRSDLVNDNSILWPNRESEEMKPCSASGSDEEAPFQSRQHSPRGDGSSSSSSAHAQRIQVSTGEGWM
eukprot:GGOE01061895.1.p1 GENE.GGOE01061895.1~~GGOE01061895.1.p1  ORF type:complete len:785 (+),score=210.54 GGOE01061895.1:32-2386(+)